MISSTAAAAVRGAAVATGWRVLRLALGGFQDSVISQGSIRVRTELDSSIQQRSLGHAGFPLIVALLQVSRHFQTWEEESPLSHPHRSAAAAAALGEEEEEEEGWETSDPCPLPPSSSTAEKSPQNGTETVVRLLVARPLARRLALERVCCLCCRIVENGQERVEVEEDGQLKSLTVNGKEQLLRLDSK